MHWGLGSVQGPFHSADSFLYVSRFMRANDSEKLQAQGLRRDPSFSKKEAMGILLSKPCELELRMHSTSMSGIMSGM